MRFLFLALLLASANSASAQVDSTGNERNSSAVDVALVLAVDVSYSMTADELKAQREGYAQAVTSREFLEALKGGPHGKIALAFFEWSASDYQKIIVPWRLIDSPEAATAAAAEIMDRPVRPHNRTSISGAINFAIPLFEENPYGGRRVIDISGNGPNNDGEPVTQARDLALAKGITINGLAMMLKEPSHRKATEDIDDLDVYYEDCVIGGRVAFVRSVKDGEQFKEAIRTQLVAEVADMTPDLPRVSPAQKEKRVSCLIGEEMRDKMMASVWGAPSAKLNPAQLLLPTPPAPLMPLQDTEIPAIRAHFKACWTPPQTGPSVELWLSYAPDGTYSSQPNLVNPTDSTEYSSMAAEVFRQISKCPPLKFRKRELNQARSFTWRFESQASTAASK